MFVTAEQPKSWWGAGSSTVTAEQPRSWVEGGNYELQNRVKDLTYKKVSSELRTRRTLRTLKDGYMSSVESRYIQLQTRVREGQYNASGVAVVHNMGPSGPCCRRRCQRYRAIRPAAGSGGGGGSSSAEAAGVPPPPGSCGLCQRRHASSTPRLAVCGRHFAARQCREGPSLISKKTKKKEEERRKIREKSVRPTHCHRRLNR